jgi:hypothetical protein
VTPAGLHDPTAALSYRDVTRSHPMDAPPRERREREERPPRRFRGPIQALRGLLWTVVIVWMGFAIWLVFFGMPCTAVVAAVTGTVLLPPVRVDLRTVAMRGVVLAVIGVALMAWGHVALMEFQDSVDGLSHQIRHEGAESLAFEQRAGIYGLNVVMGIGGYAVGYPEAARETLMLAVPGPLVRHWGSEFALRSPRVCDAVQQMIAEAEATDADSVQLTERSVSWPQYGFGQDSLRVALALNCPLVIQGTASRAGGRWRLDLVGSARVEYPDSGRVSLLGQVHGREIALEEGMFHALQDVGWLHPYTAKWSWTVYSDDPRLHAAAADLSWRESTLKAFAGFLRELARRWG